MAKKSNTNQFWVAARKGGQTIQGNVLCTFAPIFVLTQNGIQRVYTFQSKQFSDITLIEDAFEKELQIMHETGKLSLYKKFHLFGEEDFFNPTTLHLARLTDAALEKLNTTMFRTQNVVKYLNQSPYVLYVPARYRWAFSVRNSLNPTTNGNDGTGVKIVKGESERDKKNKNALLLGVAASVAMNMFNI